MSQDGQESSIRDRLVICLQQQLSEYELLKSMYPENDAMIVTDSKALEEINELINGSSNYKPPHLDFILKLNIDKLRLEVSINLPSFYPDEEEPDIYVRCNQLNRAQESNLNAKLSKYIKESYEQDVCLYTALLWLQDNIDSITHSVGDSTKEKIGEKTANNNVKEKFARLWIHSHHIYNKRKREEILSVAKELHLTGFCLSGKPGIVCIEGLDNNCSQWWKIIKSMNWKKIVVRKSELFDLDKQTEEQKFTNFKEIHLDMGGLSKYLNDNGLSYAFQDIFGFSDD